MLRLILEAALRSMVMAVVVWGGMRIFRVRAVLAQKVAWVLVLAAAAIMPLAMRAPWLALGGRGFVALRIPAVRVAVHPPVAPSQGNENSTAGQVNLADAVAFPRPLHARETAQGRKPSAGHRTQGPGEIPASTAMSQSAPTMPIPEDSRIVPDSGLHRSGVSKPAQNWSWDRLRAGVGWAYLAVAGILLLRILAGLAIALLIRWRSKTVSGELAAFFPSGQAVRVSHALSTPVTIGSTIVLPANCEEWDEAKLRIVLAHERSHVRQRDFYLQLAAAAHVAVFWFSPLGWWLQRRLSELGEALSDRAGLEQASNPASYAQVLLEFAAQPRRTRIPMAGVAMARTSNVSSRIERVLNARLFRVAFTGGRRHALLAAVLVPAVLVAVIAGIRIVPQVQAARTQSAGSGSAQAGGQSSNSGSAQAVGRSASGAADSSTGPVAGQVSGAVPDRVDSADAEEAGELQAPPAAPVAPAPPPAPVVSSDEIRNRAMVALDLAEAQAHKGYAYASDDDGDAFAIVHENSDKTIQMDGNYNDEFAKIRKNFHGNYIWFERDGKSYVITDPATIAKSEALFKGNPALDVRMKVLTDAQAKLDLEMAKLEPLKIDVKLDSPEIKVKLDKLQVELKELDKVKIKEITDKVNVEVLEDLQSKMGEIQGEIGEIQGKIGEQQGSLGEKQGEIGERMGKLGEEMGKIGEQQGKLAEEASRKMKSVLDQAIKDGKAKPVE